MSEKAKGQGRPRKNPHLGPRMNVMFRLNRDVQARVVALAEAEGRSLSEMIERIVNLHFEAADMRVIVREEIAAALPSASLSLSDRLGRLERANEPHHVWGRDRLPS